MLNESVIESLNNLVKKSCNSSRSTHTFLFSSDDNYFKIYTSDIDKIYPYIFRYSATVLKSLSDMFINPCTDSRNSTAYGTSGTISVMNDNDDQVSSSIFIYGFAAGLLIVGLFVATYCMIKNCVSRTRNNVINESSRNPAIIYDNDVNNVAGKLPNSKLSNLRKEKVVYSYDIKEYI